MATVKIASSEIEYFVEGEGPALMLIHGTGGNAETTWGHLVPFFSKYRKVIRPNYSGSGKTHDNGAPLSLANLAEQVLASADASGAEQFDMIGYSLGAAVAMYIAGEYPNRIRRVVLLAGFASAQDSRLKLQFELWQQLIFSNPRSAAAFFVLNGFSPSFISRLPEAMIAANIENIVANTHWEGMQRQIALDLSLAVTTQARKITSPTLSIGCTYDYLVTPAHARELQLLIKDAQYLEISSGHLAPLEVPDQCVAIAREFLDHDLL